MPVEQEPGVMWNLSVMTRAVCKTRATPPGLHAPCYLSAVHLCGANPRPAPVAFVPVLVGFV